MVDNNVNYYLDEYKRMIWQNYIPHFVRRATFFSFPKTEGSRVLLQKCTLINCIVKNWTDSELYAIWKIAHLVSVQLFLQKKWWISIFFSYLKTVVRLISLVDLFCTWIWSQIIPWNVHSHPLKLGNGCAAPYLRTVDLCWGHNLGQKSQF